MLLPREIITKCSFFSVLVGNIPEQRCVYNLTFSIAPSCSLQGFWYEFMQIFHYCIYVQKICTKKEKQTTYSHLFLCWLHLLWCIFLGKCGENANKITPGVSKYCNCNQLQYSLGSHHLFFVLFRCCFLERVYNEVCILFVFMWEKQKIDNWFSLSFLALPSSMPFFGKVRWKCNRNNTWVQ